MYLLGYEIGSSFVSASLVDGHTQKTFCTVQYPQREMLIISQQKGWAEQEPDIWWYNICQVTEKLLKESKIKAHEIKSVGISYQMHGLVLVDKNLEILRPSIIWCDSRAAPIGQEAFQDIGINYCLNNFLNSPGNFTASKLKWVKDNEPDVYRKIYKVMLPGEYVTMKLTNEIYTTYSGLSESVLWNFKKKEIAKEVMDFYGFDASILPDIAGTFESIGAITAKAASDTGLPAGIPVAYRAGDQPNNAMSLNVLRKGEIAATSGASGVVYGIVDHLLYDKQSRINAFAHVNYEENFDKIGILLCINGAGSLYSWMKDQIALPDRNYDDMERMLSSVPVGSDGICILPFGNGSERLFDNKNIESHILNLVFNRHTRAHMYRASLEGVAFSFVYGINLLKEMGLVVKTIRVANDNMFRSKVFSQTIATLLGTRIEVVDTTGSVGAAKASGVGIGLYNSIEEALYTNSFVNIYEPSFNYASCSQAYEYWVNCLNKNLQDNNINDQQGESMLFSEYLSMKKEIEMKNLQLDSKTLQTEKKQHLIDNVRVIVNSALEEKNEAVRNDLLQKAKKILNRTSAGNYEGNAEFNFSLMSDDYVKKLKATFPFISFEDLKMCYYIHMNLNTKEIAERMQISIRGVETKRYRLRKKLRITKGISLVEFLNSNV